MIALPPLVWSSSLLGYLADGDTRGDVDRGSARPIEIGRGEIHIDDAGEERTSAGVALRVVIASALNVAQISQGKLRRNADLALKIKRTWCSRSP